MKRRILSLLLSLVLLLSLAGPSTIVYADDNSGMRINKNARDNGDGTYTISLEAYATGSKVISEITKDVPTDIILVLDQSGSMTEDMGTVSFIQSNPRAVSSREDAKGVSCSAVSREKRSLPFS